YSNRADARDWYSPGSGRQEARRSDPVFGRSCSAFGSRRLVRRRTGNRDSYAGDLVRRNEDDYYAVVAINRILNFGAGRNFVWPLPSPASGGDGSGRGAAPRIDRATTFRM